MQLKTPTNPLGPQDALVALPRYMVVARSLIQLVGSGHYPVGSILPTEHELCEQYGVSRFTVREALKHLAQGGLIRRRTKTGTEVIAKQVRSPYVQTLDSIQDFLQYADNTELRFIKTETVVIDEAVAQSTPCPAGESWTLCTGLRFQIGSESPVAMSRVYLSPSLRGVIPRVKALKATVHEMIEEAYNVQLLRIEQRIFAIGASRDDAKLLGIKPGTPALRTVRSYFDEADRLLEVSDSIHPGDRFVYHIEVKRGRTTNG